LRAEPQRHVRRCRSRRDPDDPVRASGGRPNRSAPSIAGDGPLTKEEHRHLHEVRCRLDAGAVLAAQAILGEVELSGAVEGLLSLVENCRLQLKAIGQ